MLTPGDKVGPYEILAPIGAGGMGEVYRARDPRLDRTVAIKRLKGEHGASLNNPRFEQEARAVAALNHPHICQIYDIGPDYLVLEFIEGSPLKGPLPLEQALRFATQIAQALEAAHAKGILHRDLKPGNILVTASGAKLLDFGLAKLTADEDATQTMAISGTLLYMSPEQAEAKPVDVRTDIFSFGAVLYEMLTGRRAFESLGAVLRDEPARLDSPAAEIIKRCVAKQPGERFQSMGEVRAALEKLAARPAEQKPSIAVLPFADMSAGKDQEYFSDGLAEEILNLLAKIPDLKVIARTSSFAFRGEKQDIRKIAEALSVGTILEGSVRKAGNRIRVTAQLIDASDGSHLWSERYDRELTDVFEVQDEIAAAISKALHLKLAPQLAAPERYKPSLRAYEAYLKGRHELYQLTPESMARGKEYFEQAISLDPKFVPPYCALASYCISLAISGERPALEVMPQAQAWAHKALEIDPASSEAHATLGAKAYMFDYDWNEAARRFALAVAHEPVPASTCAHYVLYKSALGRAEDAEALMRHAVDADPLMHFNRVSLAILLSTAGRDEEAERECRHILELDENFYAAWATLGRLHFERGEISEALRCLEKVYAGSPYYQLGAGMLAGLLARTGEQERADELLGRIGEFGAHGVARAQALYHLSKGETERVFDWWEKLIDERDPFAVRMAFWGQGSMRALRSNPRWPVLARRINFPRGAW